MICPFPDMFQQTEWASPKGKPNGAAHGESNGAVKRRRRKVEQVLDKPIIVDADVAIEPDAAPVVDDVIDPDAAHRVDDQATIEPDATAAVNDEGLIEDPDARRRVGYAINAMRIAESEHGRLLAIRRCARTLDPVQHHDAIAHLVSVSRDMFDLKVDMIQETLAEGARHRERDLAARQRDFAADKPLPNAPPRFRLIPFEELKPSSERSYLIQEVFPRVGLVIVWGPRKCGKSFWVTDAMLHIALGWPYRGRKVVQGPVVYCAFEGQDGYLGRAEAFRQHNLADHTAPVPFHLVARRMRFASDHSALIADITAQIAHGTKPVAVVLDTLNRSLGGSELDDRDMGSYIEAVDAVREAFGCLVIIVHHCGHEEKRPRGHTLLPCAADSQIAVKRNGVNITSTVEFAKDGPEGAVIASRLVVIEIGTDADGDPITSCVVAGGEAVPAATPETKLTGAKSDKWSNSTLGRALMATADGAPLIRPFPDGPLVTAVSVETVRAEFYIRYPGDGQNAKRAAWNRDFPRAVKEGFADIREINGVQMMWLCKTERSERDRTRSPRSFEAQPK